jgi:hypothetical protein
MAKPKSGPELHQNPLTLQEKNNFQLADFPHVKAYATSQTHFIPNQLCLPIIHVQYFQTAHVQFLQCRNMLAQKVCSQKSTNIINLLRKFRLAWVVGGTKRHCPPNA